MRLSPTKDKIRSQPSLCLKAHHQHSPLVLQKGCNVAGLVAGGSTGINDVGAWWGRQQHGWEAAGLTGQKTVGSWVNTEPAATSPHLLPSCLPYPVG